MHLILQDGFYFVHLVESLISCTIPYGSPSHPVVSSLTFFCISLLLFAFHVINGFVSITT